VSILAAIAFLTVLPLPKRWRIQPSDLGRSAPWYPLVGLLVGALLAGADALLGLFVATPARDALIVALALVISGGLHLDGLMDTSDGVFAPVDPARRLEIMRDSHVGSFAVAAAGLLLIGKYAALSSLGDAPRWAALIVMAVLGRWAMTLAVVLFPAGRGEGLGRLVKERARRSDLLIGGGLAGVVCLVLLSWGGLLLVFLVTLLAWLGARALTRQLPGLTGDSYGAIEETCELLALALLPLCLRLADGAIGLL
jgi:adenosylcobinamide-GDP ribazoletransferase